MAKVRTAKDIKDSRVGGEPRRKGSHRDRVCRSGVKTREREREIENHRAASFF